MDYKVFNMCMSPFCKFIHTVTGELDSSRSIFVKIILLNYISQKLFTFIYRCQWCISANIQSGGHSMILLHLRKIFLSLFFFPLFFYSNRLIFILISLFLLLFRCLSQFRCTQGHRHGDLNISVCWMNPLLCCVRSWRSTKIRCSTSASPTMERCLPLAQKMAKSWWA